MTNFASILDQKAEDVKAPPLLPTGSYLTVVQGLPETGQSSKKQTDFFKFTHRIVQPLDDVDHDELEAAFPEGVAGKTVANTFYLTENSLFMLKQFVENCGIDMTGKTMRQCVDELPNCEVVINIRHRPTQDGTRMFAEIGSTAPVSSN